MLGAALAALWLAPAYAAPKAKPKKPKGPEYVWAGFDNAKVAYPKDWAHRRGALSTAGHNNLIHEMFCLGFCWDPPRQTAPLERPERWATIHIVNLGRPLGGDALDSAVLHKTCTMARPECKEHPEWCRRAPGMPNRWCGKQIGTQIVSGLTGLVYADDTSSAEPKDPGVKSVEVIFTAKDWAWSINLVAPAAHFDRYIPAFDAVVKSLRLAGTDAP